jgi:hypothetical protein
VGPSELQATEWRRVRVPRLASAASQADSVPRACPCSLISGRSADRPAAYRSAVRWGRGLRSYWSIAVAPAVAEGTGAGCSMAPRWVVTALQEFRFRFRYGSTSVWMWHSECWAQCLRVYSWAWPLGEVRAAILPQGVTLECRSELIGRHFTSYRQTYRTPTFSLPMRGRVQTCALCSPLSTWLLLWLRLFTAFLLGPTNNLALLLHASMLARYCLVPHPMAVLGRKRM